MGSLRSRGTKPGAAAPSTSTPSGLLPLGTLSAGTDAQEVEDALSRAAAGEDDLDEIGRRIERVELDFEQWEILYRLFLQVRLRRTSRGADALVSEEEVVVS